VNPLLLDTNTLNFLVKGRPITVARFEDAVDQGKSFLLASVAHFEIWRYLTLKGAHRLGRRYEELVKGWARCALSFEDWTAAAILWADRQRIGKSISDMDLLLAILARKHEATLVTNNTKHFQDLGISLEDWIVES
jgi:tRNA(fMet)-specific endonuclease VapC